MQWKLLNMEYRFMEVIIDLFVSRYGKI